MPEAIISRTSFKDALSEGGGVIDVFDPLRGCVAKVRRVGKSYFIEPTPEERYPISQCDAIINWATQVGRMMCQKI